MYLSKKRKLVDFNFLISDLLNKYNYFYQSNILTYTHKQTAVKVY